MKTVKHIIVHCSDSEWGCAAVIDEWHKARGWKGIGYHFVVGNGRPAPDLFLNALIGAVEVGRRIDGDGFIEPDEVGSHALGYNDTSIGVCLIGKKDFAPEQMLTACLLVAQLMNRFGVKLENVLGHYETPKAGGKTCPNFDMQNFRARVQALGQSAIQAVR